MNETLVKKVLETVNDVFDQEVFSSGAETVLGLETRVEGKEDFLNELKKALTKLK